VIVAASSVARVAIGIAAIIALIALIYIMSRRRQ
jgi:hypothetical protein